MSSFSLSTAWVTNPECTLQEVLEFGKRAGFDSFELGVTPARFKPSELPSIIASAGVRVVSVHNICTDRKLDDNNLRGDMLSTLDSGERKRTVAMTVETIKTAESLGVDRVVLHLGAVDMRHARRKHMKMVKYLSQLGMTREFESEMKRLVTQRRKESGPFLEAVMESLSAILSATKGSPVKIAIENRYFFHEIPLPTELANIFSNIPDPRLCYWHDLGHAHMMEMFGVCKKGEWLSTFSQRIAGIHIHDAVKGRDHMPPGKGGSLDFQAHRDLFTRPDVAHVVEIAAGWPFEDVKGAKKFLDELMAR